MIVEDIEVVVVVLVVVVVVVVVQVGSLVSQEVGRVSLFVAFLKTMVESHCQCSGHYLACTGHIMGYTTIAMRL